jgi:peptidoglycan/LPS O-acetylase OafA/YrhL
VPAIGSWHLPGLVVVSVVAMVVTGLLATASWYLLERPVLRLERRF